MKNIIEILLNFLENITNRLLILILIDINIGNNAIFFFFVNTSFIRFQNKIIYIHI